LVKKIPHILKEIKKVQVPEIDYTFNKNVSYSQLSIYSNCPYQWGLKYRDGFKVFEPSIHAVFGTALHITLQEYLTVMYEESKAAADRLDSESTLKRVLKEEYQNFYKKNKNIHFSNPAELAEFFDDGLKIINYVKKKSGAYFSKRGWYLVGCEVPIVLKPLKGLSNVLFSGFIDVVFYHEPSNTIKILDIKTSTRGWGDKEKKDNIKTSQLVLYKKFFAEQYNFPIDNIEVEYFITRRKVYEEGDFPQKRIQEYKPAAGKVKINKASQLLEGPLNDVFNSDGSFKIHELEKRPSKENCRFCPYSNNPDLCNKNEEVKKKFTFY
jgi:hypothetical protein